MANKVKDLPRLTLPSIRRARRPQLPVQSRAFSACSRCRTDGVFRELTEMRTRVPFIEAFKKQQSETTKSRPVSAEKVERDLTPKTMSDSYTRIVSCVTHPQWAGKELNEIDITSGSRSMASGLVYQFFWPYTPGNHLYGLGCFGRGSVLQAY